MTTLTRSSREILLILLAVTGLLSHDADVRALPGTIEPQQIECARPTDAAQKQVCAAYERAILDATVMVRTISRCRERPEAELWWFDSHATILDDHTLQTHNHYRILGDERCELDTLIFYDAEGEKIAGIVDGTELTGVARQLDPRQNNCPEETCTLILDKPYFSPTQDMHLAHLEPEALPGQSAGWSTAAEINWRGRPGTTYVQWVRIVGLSTRGEVPVLELADDILEGASGGGVYLVSAEGLVHIGNVWLHRLDGHGSVMALNPKPGRVAKMPPSLAESNGESAWR